MTTALTLTLALALALSLTLTLPLSWPRLLTTWLRHFAHTLSHLLLLGDYVRQLITRAFTRLLTARHAAATRASWFICIGLRLHQVRKHFVQHQREVVGMRHHILLIHLCEVHPSVFKIVHRFLHVMFQLGRFFVDRHSYLFNTLAQCKHAVTYHLRIAVQPVFFFLVHNILLARCRCHPYRTHKVLLVKRQPDQVTQYLARSLYVYIYFFRALSPGFLPQRLCHLLQVVRRALLRFACLATFLLVQALLTFLHILLRILTLLLLVFQPVLLFFVFSCLFQVSHIFLHCLIQLVLQVLLLLAQLTCFLLSFFSLLLQASFLLREVVHFIGHVFHVHLHLQLLHQLFHALHIHIEELVVLLHLLHGINSLVLIQFLHQLLQLLHFFLQFVAKQVVQLLIHVLLFFLQFITVFLLLALLHLLFKPLLYVFHIGLQLHLLLHHLLQRLLLFPLKAVALQHFALHVFVVALQLLGFLRAVADPGIDLLRIFVDGRVQLFRVIHLEGHHFAARCLAAMHTVIVPCFHIVGHLLARLQFQAFQVEILLECCQRTLCYFHGYAIS